jgi:hypothetical protein
MTPFGQKRKVKTADGETVTKPVSVVRETRGVLDGTFGRERGRQLVISLDDGDLISAWPKGTRGRRLSMTAEDFWRQLLRNKANKAQLEKARALKERKKLQALRRKIAREDQKLRSQP